MTIVGVSGYARAGKDSIGEVLIDAGYQRRAFADKMKAVALELDPIINDRWRLRPLVAAVGWEIAKKDAEVRRFLQRLGTDAGRRHLGEDIWVNALFDATEPEENYVITDVRFPNEAEAVRAHGGIVWRVLRPGIGPANAHSSETALDAFNFDAWIVNNRDLAHLRTVVLARLDLHDVSMTWGA